MLSHFAVDCRDGPAALSFLTDVFAQLTESQDVDVATVHKMFSKAYGHEVNSLEDVFGEDSEYDVGRQLAGDFVQRAGFQQLPQVGLTSV